jgi:hypothetical protein
VTAPPIRRGPQRIGVIEPPSTSFRAWSADGS